MNKVSNNIRATLFDLDDTLVDTIGTQWKKHIFIAREHYGKQLTEAEIRGHYGKPIGEYVCALYGTTDVEEAVGHSMRYRSLFPKQLFPETVPTLLSLKAAGQLLGIVTKSTRAGLENDLAALGLAPGLLDYTQTADDTFCQKPDPRVFDPALKWLQEQGIQRHEVRYAGDSFDDMWAASGAGVTFLGVERGLVSAEEFEAAGALSVPHIGYLAVDLATPSN